MTENLSFEQSLSPLLNLNKGDKSLRVVYKKKF